MVAEQRDGAEPSPGPRVRPTVRKRAAAQQARRERLRPAEPVLSPDAAVASRVFRVRVNRDGRVHLGAVVLRSRVLGIERRNNELWLLPAKIGLPLLRVRGTDDRLRLWLTGGARLPAYELGLRAFGHSREVIVEVRVDGVIVICAREAPRVRAGR